MIIRDEINMENKIFDKNIFCNFVLNEDLDGGINYLKGLDDLTLYESYIKLFKDRKLKKVFENEYLDDIYKIYQLYFIECFYDKIPIDEAEKNLISRFKSFFSIKKKIENVYEIEENQISTAFNNAGYYFVGGRTSGYLGPYIWSDSELKEFDVEINNIVTKYQVRINSNFKALSWIDFISNGMISPGGWADPDGIITCIKEKWDFDSDAFKISLLKHEAQHQMDYKKYGINVLTADELEYRAKLMELIYFDNTDKFNAIISEANDALVNNGHALASAKIKKDFERSTKSNILELSIAEIQNIARELFEGSTIELDKKYK